jgi:hypothetical protein
MTAAELIESLTRLGVIINDSLNKDPTTKLTIDVALKNADLKKVVTDLTASFSDSDFTNAIAVLEQKQAALLGGGTLASLSTDKLIQYAELGNVRVVLAGKQVAAAMNPQFLTWLTTDALPILLKAAPLVIPLLL